MKYTVSESENVDLAIELFNKIRVQPSTRERFEWLYTKNPAGKARIWILSDTEGRPVGFTAGYPREVWVDGRLCQALNCGDFSIDVNHRTLGPAIMLRQPAKKLVDSGEFSFLYAHPLPAMLPVHTRVGHRRFSEMTRWVYPLKFDKLLDSNLGLKLGWAVGSPLNLGLKVWRALKPRNGTQVKVDEAESFSRDFDALDQLLGQQYGVIGRRNHAHLAWRFIENPALKPKILEARDSDNRLVGYLVLKLGTPLSKIHDLACLPNIGIEEALLTYAARRGSEVGSSAISCEVLRFFPALPDLKRFGFWDRKRFEFLKKVEPLPAVCYAGKEFWGKACVEDEHNWFMTIGDRDV